MTAAPLRDLGLRYAALGWYISPLKPLAKLPFANCNACRRPTADRPNPDFQPHDTDQCPCIPAGGWCHGFRAATTDPNIIDGWISRSPAANIAVSMGASGLLVLDFDDHPGRTVPADPLPGITPDPSEAAGLRHGADVFGLLCRVRNQPWPSTLTGRTPTGNGHQQWFTVADGSRFTPSAGALGWQVDVKASGSYAIAPGSRTREGVYEAVIGMNPVQLPDWIAAELERTGHVRQPQSQRPADWTPTRLTGGRAYVQAAVAAELNAVASAAAGQRHEQLVKSSVALGSFVGAGLLDRDDVHEALTAAAEAAGVSRHEHKAQGTIRSGIDYGSARPRTIPAPRGATR